MSIITGEYGMAELVEGDLPSTIERWVVTSRLYHPMYYQYMIVLIHLEPGPNLPVPELQFPEATHAVSCVTLDPHTSYSDPASAVYLTPFNLEVHFKATDEQAVEVLRTCVTRVLTGDLNPESGAIPHLNAQEWKKQMEEILT